MNRLLALLALLLAGLGGPAPAASARTPIATAPAHSLTLHQRTTQSLPGTNDLLLTIGDITAGQTLVSLEWRDGERVLGPRSLRAFEAVEIEVTGQRWLLTLEQLHNELVGDDWAEFSLSRAEVPSLLPAAAPDMKSVSAAREIEALIAAVENQTGAIFIRNGGEHSAADAANHLRRKLRGAGSRIKTAEQFIDHLASKSSSTGNPYALRLANGKTVDAGEWFRAKLAEIRGRRGV